MKKIINFLKESNRWLHLMGGALAALAVAFRVVFLTTTSSYLINLSTKKSKCSKHLVCTLLNGDTFHLDEPFWSTDGG